jgi:hypothetical protein
VRATGPIWSPPTGILNATTNRNAQQVSNQAHMSALLAHFNAGCEVLDHACASLGQSRENAFESAESAEAVGLVDAVWWSKVTC